MGEIVEAVRGGLHQLAGGGWLLIPLTIYSLLVHAIMIERAYNMRRSKLVPGPFITSSIYRELERGRPDIAIRMCERKPGPLTNVLREGILHRHYDRNRLELLVGFAIEAERPHLERYLWVLSLIASIAMYTGLLGTIWGMIRSFGALDQLRGGDSGVATDVAAGISQSLLTTVAGLLVALPAYIAYNYFSDRAKSVLMEMERYGMSLVRFLTTSEYKLFQEEASFDQEPLDMADDW